MRGNFGGRGPGIWLRAGMLLAGTAMAPLPALAANLPPRAVILMAQADQAPQAATIYLWSASKAEDGSVTLSGDVPSDDTRQTLLDSIGGAVVDSEQLASGAPDNFAANAVAALGILAALDSGRVAYDGTLWSISGKVDSPDKATAAQSAFNASPLKVLGASYVVEAPAQAAESTRPAAQTPAAPVVSPNYAWSAEKTGDGTITFNGTVPTPALKNVLADHAGTKAIDESVIAKGAPESFVGGALYGLDALMALESGKLLFAGGEWSLAGLAKDDAAEQAAHDALHVIDTGKWRFDIRTPVAAEAPPANPPAAPQQAEAAPAPAPPAQPAAAEAASAPYVFRATKAADGTVTFAGDLPTEGARGYFADAVGKADTSNVQIVPNAPDGFVAGAMAGLPALGELASGELDFDGKAWSLRGRAATPDIQKAVQGEIAALSDATAWNVVIEGPSPLDLCKTNLASFSAANSIAFEAQMRFAKGTDAQLDALAKLLADCPDVKVYIEGHTDSDGEAKANLALSVARAEAVAAQLTKRGIASNRLYAVGYGETVPLVPNTTKANKAKNRRIEVKLEEPSIPN